MIQSGKFDDFYPKYYQDNITTEECYLDMMDADHAESYTIEVPAGTTIYGVPEVHVKLKTPDVDQDNLMVSAKLMDTSADGKGFKAYMVKGELRGTLPLKAVGTFEYGGGGPTSRIFEYVPSLTDTKLFSCGWTDLLDPGCGYEASSNVIRTATTADTYYDYTIYLTPTVYTVAEGHDLKLLIFAQDPFKTRADHVTDDTPYFADDKVDEVYSFTIDNASVEVRLPITK